MFLLYLYDKAANLKKCGQMPKILIVNHSVLIKSCPWFINLLLMKI